MYPHLTVACPFCGRPNDDHLHGGVHAWECPCGALACGAPPFDLDDAADVLLELLGLDLRASEAPVPVGESGMLTLVPYDAERVKQDLQSLLTSRGYEVRLTSLDRTAPNDREDYRPFPVTAVWVKKR